MGSLDLDVHTNEDLDINETQHDEALHDSDEDSLSIPRESMSFDAEIFELDEELPESEDYETPDLRPYLSPSILSPSLQRFAWEGSRPSSRATPQNSPVSPKRTNYSPNLLTNNFSPSPLLSENHGLFSSPHLLNQQMIPIVSESVFEIEQRDSDLSFSMVYGYGFLASIPEEDENLSSHSLAEEDKVALEDSDDENPLMKIKHPHTKRMMCAPVTAQEMKELENAPGITFTESMINDWFADISANSKHSENFSGFSFSFK